MQHFPTFFMKLLLFHETLSYFFTKHFPTFSWNIVLLFHETLSYFFMKHCHTFSRNIVLLFYVTLSYFCIKYCPIFYEIFSYLFRLIFVMWCFTSFARLADTWIKKKVWPLFVMVMVYCISRSTWKEYFKTALFRVPQNICALTRWLNKMENILRRYFFDNGLRINLSTSLLSLILFHV